MNCIIFEDRAVSRLYPITLGRAAYAISCGGYHLAELVCGAFATCRGVVRHHLGATQAQKHTHFHETPFAHQRPTLLVNAALVPSVDNLDKLTAWAAQRRPARIEQDGRLVAALVGPDTPVPTQSASYDDFLEFLGTPDITQLPLHDLPLDVFHYAHDVVRYNEAIIQANLQRRLTRGDYREIRDGLFTSGEISLGENVVIDASRGPILVEPETTIGPFCFLRGPAYLGRNVRVIEHSAIKDSVTLGHTTKVGGEVEATIIEPYSNKQHHGFLGHSYLGSWINLGAGTSNSDLKNTYGTVKMDYPAGRVATDMQFIGAIVGDYSKTAINTGIFTGKTIGVCSMLYGFITTNVPSFVNYARLFGQVTELPPEVMIATQQRMFHRRNVPQTACDVQLIHDMYLLTREERHLTGEPLVL